uniref:preprotein translocase subunit SecY n=1 Tax=Lithothamnion corallioides TaxID=1277934 RepID=UPI0023F422E3|nr:preprotein translocase subunit SecY [Lithothamnion corallioides]WEA77098.1 preprotein translocase subunit SecY [Lithothamnion corallioides]
MNLQNTLTKKLLATLLILILARLGIFIPIPSIDHDTFYSSVGQNALINFLNIFSGGGFSTIGMFALGIVPYINASIIVQLLTKIIPEIENLQKEEGESGRRKITQITRYLTLIWALTQSLAIAFWIKPYVFNWNLNFIIDCILTLTTGSIIVMWLSELITEYGVGNGASLLIFQNIISGIPKNIQSYSINAFNVAQITPLLIFFSLFLFMLSVTILIQEGTKKIPIISARQLNKTSQIDSKSYIPLKMNQGGVMPIVFASAAMTIPSYLIEISNNNIIKNTLKLFSPNGPLYIVLYGILIIIFSYFYSSLVLSPDDVAKNLKKMGASIPGIRPGDNTSQYLKTILDRLTFLGSIFLFSVALIPSIITNITHLNAFQGLGATSLLILVGVAIDTAKQIQTYIISEKYNSMIQ